jgi:predicted dehydrogenase
VVERLPRLGFLGVGWIGRQRMEALDQAGTGCVVAVADRDREAARSAAGAVGCEAVCEGLDALLDHELDGVVIATPTALHATQVEDVLERGLPVFCQKPLGRPLVETRRLVDRARPADLALGVDMSYRHLAAVAAALRELRAGRIGEPYAADLVFHNAYGPDKPWVRDVELAGGGALIDLGPHLLDLARLFLGELSVAAVHADLFAAGRRLEPDPDGVEDLALAQISLTRERVVRLGCSWWIPAGQDAVIEATFYGPEGALRVANVGGSFYDFEALALHGRMAETLARSPDDWGGRALVAWSRSLAVGRGFDPEVESLVDVAAVIDAVYGRGVRSGVV